MVDVRLLPARPAARPTTSPARSCRCSPPAAWSPPNAFRRIVAVGVVLALSALVAWPALVPGAARRAPTPRRSTPRSTRTSSRRSAGRSSSTRCAKRSSRCPDGAVVFTGQLRRGRRPGVVRRRRTRLQRAQRLGRLGTTARRRRPGRGRRLPLPRRALRRLPAGRHASRRSTGPTTRRTARGVWVCDGPAAPVVADVVDADPPRRVSRSAPDVGVHPALADRRAARAIPTVSSATISSATARARGGIANRSDASPVYSTPSTRAPRERRSCSSRPTAAMSTDDLAQLLQHPLDDPDLLERGPGRVGVRPAQAAGAEHHAAEPAAHHRDHVGELATAQHAEDRRARRCPGARRRRWPARPRGRARR